MTEIRWQVVYDTVRNKITVGDLRPGDRVPAELALARWFGYSRATVRRALTTLAAEGLISSGGGSRGRRVLPDRAPPLVGDLPWERHPDPPHDPCANPRCQASVYWPDTRSFWASVWIPEQARDNPITQRACSIRCLALVVLDPDTNHVDTRWGT